MLAQLVKLLANEPSPGICAGGYQLKPDLPFVPGLEAAGDVVALGDGVQFVTVQAFAQTATLAASVLLQYIFGDMGQKNLDKKQCF